MTFQEARRYLKSFIKSEPEGIPDECYEFPMYRIEDQINTAMEKGAGIHKFLYLQTMIFVDKKSKKPSLGYGVHTIVLTILN